MRLGAERAGLHGGVSIDHGIDLFEVGVDDADPRDLATTVRGR
jgi:hypothetical protein